MEAFKLVYQEKCRDFVTKPIEPLMLAVSAAIDAGVVITNFNDYDNTFDGCVFRNLAFGLYSRSGISCASRRDRRA